MTIRYNNTRGDILYANFLSLMRNRYLHVLWSIFIIWICYTALQGSKTAPQSMSITVATCVFMAVICYVFFFTATFAVVAGMILLRKNKGVLGEHSLTLSDEGLVESTIYNETLNRWAAYHKTVSTKKHLLLYVSEGQFHVISKKRPLIEGDLAAFEAALNEKTKLAQ